MVVFEGRLPEMRQQFRDLTGTLIDQIDRRVKAHALAFGGNTRHPNGGRKMRLTGARTSNEHGVLRRIGEL